MDEEIDLRSYVAVLFRYWPWILGLACVAAVAAFLISLALPSTYEASSFVVVTQGRYAMQFDSRLDTVELKNPQYRVFPTLAGTDEILQAVVDQYTPSASARLDPWGLEMIAGVVEAGAAEDPSLLVLTARSLSAADAAGIANAWADALVRKGNEIYGQSEADVEFFAQQVSQAAQAVEAASSAMIEFQGRNRAGIVTAELEARQTTEANLLQEQDAIRSIAQDLQGFRNQLAGQAEGQSSSLANQLTALLLQIKAFNAQAETPLQIQIDSTQVLSSAPPQESALASTLAGQIAILDGLMATLAATSAAIDTHLEALHPEILSLQQELESIRAEGSRLTQILDLARETHLTLTRKLDESRIAAQEEHAILRIGSYAAVPAEPAGPRRVFSAAIAGLAGLVVGIVAAFCLDFWKSSAGSPPAR